MKGFLSKWPFGALGWIDQRTLRVSAAGFFVYVAINYLVWITLHGTIIKRTDMRHNLYPSWRLSDNLAEFFTVQRERNASSHLMRSRFAYQQEEACSEMGDHRFRLMAHSPRHHHRPMPNMGNNAPIPI